MDIYIVKPGDTVRNIAQQFNVPEYIVSTLNNLNEIPNLVVGQALLILRPLRLQGNL